MLALAYLGVLSFKRNLYDAKSAQYTIEIHQPLACTIPTSTEKEKTTDDKFLMYLFSQHGYRGDTLFTLNVCCMYLHAVTLFNITTADGTHASMPA
jgi:hypothetical protein